MASSAKPTLIFWDEALAAGRLETATQFVRLASGSEGSDQGAVKGPLLAQVHLADQHLAAAELVRVFGLQAVISRLCIGLVTLRGDLHCVAAVCGRRRNRGSVRRGASRRRRGRRWHGRGAPPRRGGGRV